MCSWFDGSGGWMGGLMMIMTALFGGAIIYGAFALIRGLSGYKREGGTAGKALAIARERFAQGDITKEEFDQIKKEL